MTHPDPKPLSFPPTLTAHGHWTRWKSLDLCGATPKDRLCLISFKTAHSGKAPLGFRDGFVLHDGLAASDPVLAAAGDEAAGSSHLLNPNSVVLLSPRGGGDAKDDGGMDMHAVVMRVAKDAQNGVVFHFAMNTGDDDGESEECEWRKVDGPAAEKGFRLVRRASSGSGADGETIAVVKWATAWPRMTPAFSLELAGSAKSGALGGRRTLLVVVTAVRLYVLRVQGKTGRMAARAGVT